MLIFKIDLEDVRAYPDESVNWRLGACRNIFGSMWEQDADVFPTHSLSVHMFHRACRRAGATAVRANLSVRRTALAPNVPAASAQ
jgi:hypothetical protein